MNQESIVADIEARAWGVGLSINALCKRAKVHPTTFSRWKCSARNPDPKSANFGSIERLYQALAEAEATASRRRSRRAA